MIISSSLPGRLRLRDPRLRDPATLEALLQRLASAPGASEVSANPRVGSLLVTYAPEHTSEPELLKALDVDIADSEEASVKRLCSLEAAILGSLGVSVAAAVLGAKTLHVAAGVGFLAFAGVHIKRAGFSIWSKARSHEGESC